MYGRERAFGQREPFAEIRRQEVPRETPLSSSEVFFRDAYARLADELVRRPEIAEFSHVPLAEKAQDAASVQKIERGFAVKTTERAEIMEHFLEVEIGRSDWFGGVVFQTTRYDDYVNGVDAVAEWKPRAGETVVPRLAMDFTTSTFKEKLNEKLRSLRSGAKVKYFRSQVAFQDDKPVETSLYVPKVILGLDARFVADLAAVAEENSEEQQLAVGAGAPERVIRSRAFAEHPVQMLLLRQAKVQLDHQVRQFFTRLREDPRAMRAKSLASLAGPASVEHVVAHLSALSPEEAGQAMGDKLAGRWTGLSAARARILEHLTPLIGTTEDRDARRLAAKSQTHQVLVYYK